MKNFLWLLCLTCFGAVIAAACDDETTTSGATEDGGVTVEDINQINDQLSGFEADLAGIADDLTSGLGDANTTLDDANEAITDVEGEVGDLQDQIADFFDPNACSDDASGLGICTPDGIDVTAAALANIISAVCAHQLDCCDEGENFIRLGANIATQEDCEQLFVDSIENGQSPGDLQYVSGPVYGLISNALDISQAINSNDVQVGIDGDAAQACADYSAEWECDPESDEPEESEFCTPWEYVEESMPCDASLIVVGRQKAGEVCGVTGVNECEPGLRCRDTQNYFGVCAEPSVPGDNCTQDTQCNGMDQFCNQSTGECQERGDIGDDCALVDPTLLIVFTDNHPGYEGSWWQNPGAVRIECKQGLACDPNTEKCVQNCTENALCRGNYQCPEGLVCNFTSNPDLYSNDNNSFYLGTCTDPIADDGDCTTDEFGSECASGHCEQGKCVTKTAPGGDCEVAVGPAFDASCETSQCDSDENCATLCNEQEDCPAGYFCDEDRFVDEGEFTFACQPKIADGSDCNGQIDETDPGTNYECQSGRCAVGEVLTCAAKAANGDPCNQHSDCPSATHACVYDGITDFRNECTPFLATDTICSETAGSSDYACGPGNRCHYDGETSECKPLVAEGGTCDPSAGLQCVAGVYCAVFESAADKCHYGGEFPVGARCDSYGYDRDGNYRSNDTMCATGFCQGTVRTCREVIAEGEDCDADDEANRCEPGTYCKHDPDAEGDDIGVGTCTAQATVGQPCNPSYDRFDDSPLNVHDCADESLEYYDSNHCNVIRDQFVCNSNALAPETNLCDGN